MRVKPLKPGPLWRFLSSIWLAVALILVMAVLSAIGHLGPTFAPREFIQVERFFFGSWWFGGLLAMVGVNIFFGTLNRSLAHPPGWFPWRISQLPWLMVHVGLLLVIGGGLFTLQRTEGQLYVVTGSSERVMYRHDREVVVRRPPPPDGAVSEAHAVDLTWLPKTEDLVGRPNTVALLGTGFWVLFTLGVGLGALRVAGPQAAWTVGGLLACTGVFFQVAAWRHSDDRLELFGGEATLTFEKYYPTHERVPQVELDPSGAGPEVVSLELARDGAKAPALWLPVTVGYQNSRQLEAGGVTLAAQRVHARAELERVLAGQPSFGSLVVRAGGAVAVLPLDEAVQPGGGDAGDPGRIDRVLEVAGHRLHVGRLFRSLQVTTGEGGKQEAIDAAPGGELVNPAVRIDAVVYPDGRREEVPRFVFGSDEFRALNRQMRPIEGVSLDYAFPMWSVPPGRSVNVVLFPDGPARLLTQGFEGSPAAPRAPADLDALPALGADPVAIPGVGHGLTLRLAERLPSAHTVERVQWVDPKTRRDADKLPDAVFVRLKHRDGREVADWLPFGFTGHQPITLQLGQEAWTLSYQARKHTLPFDVHLNEFKIEWAPGQQNVRPLAFESKVTVKDPTGKDSIPSFDYRIYMNHTLVHKGYTLFQNSYIRQPGQPDISVFAIQNDPGEYIFYVGSLLLSVGVLAFFYVRPRLRELELRWRGQAPVEAEATPTPFTKALPEEPAAPAAPAQAEPAQAEPAQAPGAEAQAAAEAPPAATDPDEARS